MTRSPRLATAMLVAAAFVCGIATWPTEAQQKQTKLGHVCALSQNNCSIQPPCYFAGQSCNHCNLALKDFTCVLDNPLTRCTLCPDGSCGNVKESWCIDTGFDDEFGNPILECDEFSTLSTTCLRAVCSEPGDPS